MKVCCENGKSIISTVEVEEWFAMYSMYKYGHIKQEQLCLARSCNKLVHTFNYQNSLKQALQR